MSAEVETELAEVEKDEASVKDEETKETKQEPEGLSVDDQLEKLKLTLSKVNKTNRELESQIKKANKSVEEYVAKIKVLEEQIKNPATDKENIKRIQQLQDKLDEQEKEFQLKIRKMHEEHIINNFDRQIESEIVKQGGGNDPETLEFLKFKARSFYKVEQDDDGNLTMVVKDANGATEKYDKNAGNFVKNDFKDLVKNLKTGYGQFFMVKGAPGTPAASSQGNSSSDNASRANLKKRLQQEYAEAKKSGTVQSRLAILSKAAANGIMQAEIDS